MLRLYNDRTHRLEAFEPPNAPDVTMYVCGPTVYNFIHIGNGRAFLVWDVVRRYLEFRGYRVRIAQNFTDVDDKIINRANEEGTDWRELAERYIREFFVDMEALGIKRADLYPKATEHIPEMIAHIAGLVDKGHAYAVDGDVYFAVETFDHYGGLSGRSLDQMMAGARVEVDERKRNPMDFALWKSAKPGEPSWDSPWGPGRPGWHIECSAMVRKHFGDTIDIHTGGIDLTFPHHENEIAQSEALTGCTFARTWLHNGFLTIQAEKMSKSLGNVATVRELSRHYDPQMLRYFLMSVHYRQELDFSDEAIRAAGTGLNRLRKTLARYAEKLAAPTEAVKTLSDKAIESFIAGMDDDFNTPKAIATFYETAKALGELSSADGEAAGHVVARLYELGEVLGIDLATIPLDNKDLSDVTEGLSALASDLGIPSGDPEVVLEAMIAQRAASKAAKDWGTADRIRNGLKDLGISLMDKPGGETTWERAEAAAAGR